MDFNFHFDGDRLRTPGINWGYGDSDPHLVGRTSHFMVIRKAGNMDWSGRGASEYYPTTYILCSYKNDKRKDFKDRFNAEEIEKVEPGRKWRSAKEQLLKKMAGLESKWRP